MEDPRTLNHISSPVGAYGERGSALLIMMIITAAVASMVAFATITSVNQTKAANFITNGDESTDLATTIQMVYSTPQSCKANLSPGGFGVTISDIGSQQQDKSIALLSPGAAGISSQVLFGKNIRFNHELIMSMAFKTPIAVSGLANVYLADLQVRTASDKGSIAEVRSMPFYLVTKGGGALQSCYATSYVPSKTGTVLTIEDSICKQLSGTAAGIVTNGLNTIYDPSQQDCVNVNRVAGP